MIVCANQNKMFVGKVGNAMSNCVPARRLNLLSLWGHTELEKRQMDEAQKRNIFRHIQTKNCVSKTNEMTERQLSAHTENRIVVGEASNKIGKLCASQATKMCLRKAI